MPDRILRDWTDSEAVSEIGEMAESLFVRLIQKADDYGCLEANPKALRSILYPLREDMRAADIVKRMQQCAVVGLVSAYECTDTGDTRWLSIDELAGSTARGSKWYLLIHHFGQRIRDLGKATQAKPKCPRPPLDRPENLRGQWIPPPFPSWCSNPPQVAADSGESRRVAAHTYSSANASANALAGASANAIAPPGPKNGEKTWPKRLTKH